MTVPPAKPEPDPHAGADAPQPRILVADDEPGTLALVIDMLTYSGFEVVAARDGLEALVRAHQSPPDLALLDVMMPGLDGREVCRRMRSDDGLRHVPVVLFSVADETGVDWRGAGANAFVQKPFPIRHLPEIIRKHLTTPNPVRQ
jgi:CheY-like chemotaxis protein